MAGRSRFAVLPVDVSKFRRNGPSKIYAVVEQRTLARCDSEGDAELLVTMLNEAHGNKDRVDTVTGMLMPTEELEAHGLSGLMLKMPTARPHEDRMVHHTGPGWIIFRAQSDKLGNWVRWVPEGKEVQTTTKRKRR